MPKYNPAELGFADEQIIRRIKEGVRHLGAIRDATGFEERLVDRRLQSLRKRGKVHFQGSALNEGWRLLNPDGSYQP